jgi:hypothetical protein
MPHRAPLTAARLAELYDQNPSPVVTELLWEIHRLRAVILRAHQIRRTIARNPPAMPRVLWEAFTDEIDAEPCVTDPPTPRQQRARDRYLQDIQADPTESGKSR